MVRSPWSGAWKKEQRTDPASRDSPSPRGPPSPASRAHGEVKRISPGWKRQIRTQISTPPLKELKSLSSATYECGTLGKLSHLPASRVVLRLKEGQKPSIFSGPCGFGRFSFPSSWQDPDQSPGEAHQTALPSALAKPGLQQEATPTLGISIDLEDIGM